MIEVTYQPHQDPLRAAQGWGRCMVSINHRPCWYAGTEQNPSPIEWTWVDLLDHLGRYWLDIITEAPWPIARLAAAMQEGKDFWTLAEDDWADMSEEAADKEEHKLLAYTRPRNLAQALNGLSLPAIYCFRQGLDMLLCPEGQQPQQVPIASFIQALENLGSQIDQGIGHTAQPRAHAAQQKWRMRLQDQTQRQIAIATGLNALELNELQQGQTNANYWNLQPSANDDTFCANGLLAAARMIAPLRLEAADKRQLLAQLRNQPPNASALVELDKLAAQIILIFPKADKPHEQGYLLAQQLRQHYTVSDCSTFPIQQVIDQIGLSVKKVSLNCPSLLAMAVWGSSGPAIVLNADKDANTGANHVQRILLAHELCHLLLDRKHALPAGDILGANTITTIVEQRAKAFAAELLLPRQSAGDAYANLSTLRQAITTLAQQFEVSPKVAKTQILNSGKVSLDDEDEIRAQLSQDRFPQ